VKLPALKGDYSAFRQFFAEHAEDLFYFLLSAEKPERKNQQL
jgi:hypothetical protein